jgi:plastocyanin
MSSVKLRAALAFVSLLPLAACDQKAPSTPQVPAVAPEVTADAAAPATSIRGSVVFDGVAPARTPVPMGGVASCAAHAGKILTETVIVDGGKLQNVLVYVKSGFDAANVPAALATPIVLQQHDCSYQPHVLALRTGQTLEIQNSDAFNHNVNAKAERNDKGRFNQTQSGGAPPITVVFDKPELLVPFGCDIHPWMRSYVHVLDHPWFAISAADGSFAIDKLPAGKYHLEAVHESLGRQQADVTLDGKAGAQVVFHFRAAK